MAAEGPVTKKALAESRSLGRRDPSVSSIVRRYRSWVSVEDWAVLRNGETGEYLPSMCCKLGNGKHARKKAAQLQPVVDAFNSLVLDGPVPGARPDRFRATRALLITMTYDHKLYGPLEAYERVGADVNRFKAALTKVMSRTHGERTSRYVSMTVKEGTKSGYPAPHMIIVFDRPIPCFLYNGKWRVQSRELYSEVHAAWERASGGSMIVDIEAIVDNSVKGTGRSRHSAITYALKYILKASTGDLPDRESQELADVTHAMMKATGQRDIIGKRFLDFLGVTKTEEEIDLMEKKNELKRLCRRREELRTLEDEHGNDFGWLGSPQCAELRTIDRSIEAVRDEIRLLTNPQSWFYVGTRRFGPGDKAVLQTWLESFGSENARIREQREIMSEQCRNYDDPDFIRAMMHDPLRRHLLSDSESTI